MIASFLAFIGGRAFLTGLAAIAGYFGLSLMSHKARRRGRQEVQAEVLKERQAARVTADKVDAAVAREEPDAKREELKQW